MSAPFCRITPGGPCRFSISQILEVSGQCYFVFRIITRIAIATHLLWAKEMFQMIDAHTERFQLFDSNAVLQTTRLLLLLLFSLRRSCSRSSRFPTTTAPEHGDRILSVVALVKINNCHGVWDDVNRGLVTSVTKVGLLEHLTGRTSTSRKRRCVPTVHDILWFALLPTLA